MSTNNKRGFPHAEIIFKNWKKKTCFCIRYLPLVCRLEMNVRTTLKLLHLIIISLSSPVALLLLHGREKKTRNSLEDEQCPLADTDPLVNCVKLDLISRNHMAGNRFQWGQGVAVACVPASHPHVILTQETSNSSAVALTTPQIATAPI
jgi:hypothetical protein